MGMLLIISKICLPLFAVIFILVGATCFLLIPKLIFNEILKRTYLGRDTNGTYNELLNKYVNPPYWMQLEVWTFSVVNSDDVMKKGAKPRVVEKGPYAFVETQDKLVRFKEGTNDTRLYYRNNRHYFFNQTLSCADCDLSDKVTVPSLVFQKIVDMTYDKSFAIREMVDLLLRYENETAYTTVKVGDLLFDGYKDPLLSLCEKNEILRKLCKSSGVPQRIGLFYQKNNTNDGLYEIDTGFPDVSNIGHVYAWNGMPDKLNNSYWFGDGARMINGTDSQLFAPKELLKRENFHIFAGQACRSVEMEFYGPIDVIDLPANRYTTAKAMGDVKLQKDMGFCAPNTPTFFEDTNIQEPGCLPYGLMDMGGCVPGAPRIYASNAHFSGSSAALRYAVDGIVEPSPIKDNVFVDIEPLTGVVVRALQRSQLNVGVLRGKLNIVSSMLNATIVPMVWMNESVIFDAETREQLLQVYHIMRYANVAAIGSVFIGVGLFVAFLLLTFVFGRRRAANVNLNGDLSNESANVDTSFFDNEAAQDIVNENFEPNSPLQQHREFPNSDNNHST